MLGLVRAHAPLAWLVFGLFLAGCTPRTLSPLPMSETGDNDARLLGEWVGSTEDETIHATVSRLPDGRLRIIAVPLDRDETNRDDETLVVDAATAHLANGDYMTASVIRIGDDTDTGEGYVVCRYTFTATGEVEISIMSEDAVIADVEAGTVAGIVTRGKWIDEVSITAPSAALANYIAAADPERLFANSLAAFRRAGE